jgi:hypothetical protein
MGNMRYGNLDSVVSMFIMKVIKKKFAMEPKNWVKMIEIDVK